jgi:O-antigen/teichoic acid export membrane protein
MTFELPVVGEKVKPHQSLALHIMIGIALIGFGLISYVFYAFTYIITKTQSPLFDLKLWAIIMLVFGFVIIFIAIFRKRWMIYPKNNRIFRIIELIACVLFIVLSYDSSLKMPAAIFSILGLGILFAIFWESGNNKPLFVSVSDEGVTLPATSRRKFLEWTEIESIILRFGTITIECTGNNYFQWNVNNINFDSEIFEAYCKSQTEKNRAKRIKDW